VEKCLDRAGGNNLLSDRESPVISASANDPSDRKALGTHALIRITHEPISPGRPPLGKSDALDCLSALSERRSGIVICKDIEAGIQSFTQFTSSGFA
jgi:hypothetical protein